MVIIGERSVASSLLRSKIYVQMSEKKEGLHTHHINGVKHDNSRRNLSVLCALCHKDVDEHHRTMHIKPDIERYINLHRKSGH